jgi:hypothetical protein
MMNRLPSSVRDRPIEQPVLAAWMLPLIVAAIAVVIVGGFYLGGPGLGMAAGALSATSIVVMAVRHPPRGAIVPAPLRDFRHHLLVVISGALEDERAIEQIVEVSGIGDVDQANAEVVVLMTARHRFLDRWASDSDPAHDQAQRYLVLSAASLAKAGVATTARVGDEDMVQAVEDELRTFPATEVILVTGALDCDIAGNAAASELESRLQADFHHLILDSPRAPVGGRESTIR